MVFEEIVLLFLPIGIVSTVLAYYYYTKMAGYCCLSFGVLEDSRREEVLKPPRWSNVLASRIEFIDETVLDILRSMIGGTESRSTTLLGIYVFPHGVGFLQLLRLYIGSFIRLWRCVGFFNSVTFYLKTIKVRMLYSKVLRLYRSNRLREYRLIASRLFNEIIELNRIIEAYSS